MNDNPQSGAPWLKAIAWIQAIAIAALAFVVSRGDDAPPSPPPPSAGPSPAAPAAPADAGRSSSSVPAPPPADAPARDVAAAAAATTAGAKPPDGTILFGRFVDAAGEPLREGVAWLTRDGEQKQIATLNAQSGSAFAVAGLPPGTLHVRTRATGYRELRDDIEIPAGAARLRHDLVLQKAWTLLVKILTPEGKPLHVALQELTKTRPQLWRLQVGALATPWQPSGDFPPTDLREADYGVGRWQAATGIAAMRDGPKPGKEYAGSLDLAEPQPLWISAVLRHRVLTTARVEPGQPEVALTVGLDQLLRDLGVIRLRVVDDMGAPIAAARVEFSDAQSGGGGEPTGADGRIEVRDLRPGLLTMSIRAKDAYSPRAEVQLEPGQTLDLGDVALPAGREFQGRCENFAGKERLSVRFTPLDAPPHPAVQMRANDAQVAEDGTFKVRLAEGRYAVRATGGGGAVAMIDTRGLAGPIVLNLAKEAPIRLDVKTGGELLELAIVDAGGRTVFRRWLQDGWKFPVLALPGDYRVELKDRSGKVASHPLHLGADGVDLRVP